MSIFARSTSAPSGNSPARMRANRSRFSSTGRSRYGLAVPGSVSVPRCARISSAVRLSTYASPSVIRCCGVLVQPLEVVRGVQRLPVPREAEPADVLLNRVDVLDVFLRRVGVVEAQVAGPAELAGDAEVEADRLRVPDVQVAVRLGRKAGRDAAAVLAGLDVLGDDCADEIQGPGRFADRLRCRLVHNGQSTII